MEDDHIKGFAVLAVASGVEIVSGGFLLGIPPGSEYCGITYRKPHGAVSQASASYTVNLSVSFLQVYD